MIWFQCEERKRPTGSEAGAERVARKFAGDFHSRHRWKAAAPSEHDEHKHYGIC